MPPVPRKRTTAFAVRQISSAREPRVAFVSVTDKKATVMRACQSALWCGNSNRLTDYGEGCVDCPLDTGSIPVSSTKKFDKFRLVEFFYPLRKQWYIITTQSWISSPKVYIISRRLYLLSQWWYTRLSPWWYTKLRFDDIHAFGVIGTLQFKPKQKVAKISFLSPLHNEKPLPLGVILLTEKS